jgi:hypothetical protein
LLFDLFRPLFRGQYSTYVLSCKVICAIAAFDIGGLVAV